MAAKALPSQDVLRQLLDYNPASGVLTWRHRDVEWFEPSATRSAAHICALWNVRYAGKTALSCTSVGGERGGYKEGNLLGQSAKAHRVIWKWMTGQDPAQIDHINGARQDNRWVNLRNVAWAENAKNHKRRKDNTTGVVGIYWYDYGRKSGKWLAKVGGRYVGYFDTFDAAVAARKQAEREFGFHENHGRSQ